MVPNPAAVNAARLQNVKHRVYMRNQGGESAGVIFNDGSWGEEWALMRSSSTGGIAEWLVDFEDEANRCTSLDELLQLDAGKVVDAKVLMASINGRGGPFVAIAWLADGKAVPARWLLTEDWNDKVARKLAKTIVTCECIPNDEGAIGSIKCTNVAGVEVGHFEVPADDNPFGGWLWRAISHATATDLADLCLVKSSGEIVERT